MINICTKVAYLRRGRIIGGCLVSTIFVNNGMNDMPSLASIEIRKTLVKDSLQLNIPLSQKRREWEEAVRNIPLPDGIVLESTLIAQVPCLWIRPKQPLDNYVVVYLHGGGLVEGSAITTREFGTRLAMTIGISLLIIDYRLAPEHPFPAALHDVTNVYKALLEQYYYRPVQIIFGGDSNGGGLALSSVRHRKAQKAHLVSFLRL